MLLTLVTSRRQEQVCNRAPQPTHIAPNTFFSLHVVRAQSTNRRLMNLTPPMNLAHMPIPLLLLRAIAQKRTRTRPSHARAPTHLAPLNVCARTDKSNHMQSVMHASRPHQTPPTPAPSRAFVCIHAERQEHLLTIAFELQELSSYVRDMMPIAASTLSRLRTSSRANASGATRT